MTVLLPGGPRAALGRVVAVGACLFGLGLTTGSAALAERTTPGPLTVGIDNDTDRLSAGAEVTYEITVDNDGPDELPAAIVSQLLPPGLTYLDADAEVVRATPTQVQWTATVPAGEEILIVMDGRVGDRADVSKVKGEPLLSTTVCVAPERGGRLAACATDSDPVGPPLAGSDEFDNVLISAVLIGAVFCGGGGYLWYRIAAHRRR